MGSSKVEVILQWERPKIVT